jgi:2-succinyl-5-enolpyruvyl-6-hydroxy-3-cyclohexene-1-carboxylate synthase
VDGSTSTAIGAAVAKKNRQSLLLEILVFFMTAMPCGIIISQNFKIILINNGGGGIFRILPGHKETAVFNTFFETSHCLTAEHLARMYGFELLPVMKTV